MASELKVTLLETSLACFINHIALCRKYVLLIQAFVNYVPYFFSIAHAIFWISSLWLDAVQNREVICTFGDIETLLQAVNIVNCYAS